MLDAQLGPIRVRKCAGEPACRGTNRQGRVVSGVDPARIMTKNSGTNKLDSEYSRSPGQRLLLW